MFQFKNGIYKGKGIFLYIFKLKKKNGNNYFKPNNKQ